VSFHAQLYYYYTYTVRAAFCFTRHFKRPLLFSMSSDHHAPTHARGLILCHRNRVFVLFSVRLRTFCSRYRFMSFSRPYGRDGPVNKRPIMSRDVPRRTFNSPKWSSKETRRTSDTAANNRILVELTGLVCPIVTTTR